MRFVSSVVTTASVCMRCNRKYRGVARSLGISAVLAVTVIVFSFKFVLLRHTMFIPPELRPILSDLSPAVQQYIMDYKRTCESYNTSVLMDMSKDYPQSHQTTRDTVFEIPSSAGIQIRRSLNLIHSGKSNSTSQYNNLIGSHSQSVQSALTEPSDVSSTLCPCIPLDVHMLNTGALDKYTRVSWTLLESLNSDITEGGEWSPTGCVARHRVAIIVPYRNREYHLKAFLSVMHPFLQSQLVHYQIFVIEQKSPEIFNRASLMNIGYIEAKKHAPFDCYIFHDVDLFPELVLNFYSCYNSPLHIGAFMNKFGYQMPYPSFFGGAIALTSAQMELINGFSNKYYGWGGEDDDMYERVISNHLTVYKHPHEIGKTFMINHTLDKLNPVNPLRFQFMKKFNAGDGLANLSYQHQKATRKLYTRVLVTIDPMYDPTCIIDPHQPPSAPNNYLDCYHEQNFLDGSISCCRNNSTVHCCNILKLGNVTFKAIMCVLAFLLVPCAIWIAFMLNRRRFQTQAMYPQIRVRCPITPS